MAPLSAQNQATARGRLFFCGKFVENVVCDRDVSLLMVLHAESPFRLALDSKRLLTPLNVREFEVHQFLIPKAAFQGQLNGHVHVRIGLCQKSADFIALVNGR